jgi:hypothetical protein
MARSTSNEISHAGFMHVLHCSFYRQYGCQTRTEISATVDQSATGLKCDTAFIKHPASFIVQYKKRRFLEV